MEADKFVSAEEQISIKNQGARSPSGYRGWFRFRLRTMLAVVFMMSLGLAWLSAMRREALRQRQLVSNLKGVAIGFSKGQPSWWPDAIDTGYLRRAEGAFVEGRDVDFQVLSEFSEFRELYIRSSNVDDLRPLSGLKKLTLLSLGESQVSDLARLTGCTDLKALVLGDNLVRDLSPLTELKQLEMLWLWAIDVEDLSPLASLTALNNLRLLDIPVRDIRPLLGLENLRQLEISGTQITPADAEKLRQALPQCSIEFTEPGPPVPKNAGGLYIPPVPPIPANVR